MASKMLYIDLNTYQWVPIIVCITVGPQPFVKSVTIALIKNSLLVLMYGFSNFEALKVLSKQSRALKVGL